MNAMKFWRTHRRDPVAPNVRCPHGKKPYEPCDPCDGEIQRLFGVEVRNPFAYRDEGGPVMNFCPTGRCSKDRMDAIPHCAHGVPYSKPCAKCDLIIAEHFKRADGGRTPPEHLIGGDDEG